MASKESVDQSITYYIAWFALILLIYYFITTSDEIAFVWKWVRIIELSVFYYVSDYFPVSGINIQYARDFLLNIDSDNLTRKTMSQYDAIYPKFFHWIYGLPFIIYGLKVIVTTEKINERYDDESILREWAPIYPHLQRYVKTNPNKKPFKYKRGNKDSYEHGVSMTPYEFAKASPPLGLEMEAKKNSSFKMPILDSNDNYDTNLAEKAFEKQLGDYFTSIEDMTDLQKKVYDCIYHRILMLEEESYPLLEDRLKDLLIRKTKKYTGNLGYGYSELTSFLKKDIEEHLAKNKRAYSKLIKKSNKKVTDERLNKIASEYFLGDEYIQNLLSNKRVISILGKIKARKVMESHAFYNTGIMSLITEARKTGILSTYTELNWVKEKDRILWYVVSTTGRNTAFVEAAGVMAHWLIECQIGRPLRQPEVHEAVVGLKIAVFPEDAESQASEIF